MKNNFEEIDQLIKETLSQEEAAFYESLDEQNIFQMVRGLFTGKNAWFLIISNILTIVFLVGFVYCCMRFFNTESEVELLKWGWGSFISILNVCMLKVYAWMQMDKNAMLREMKRLELLVISGTVKE